MVLHAFIDNFVMTPQQMQENFQWPPFYPTFSSHDPPPPPPPPTCITSERFLMLLLQRFRRTITKYNNAYNYFSNYFVIVTARNVAKIILETMAFNRNFT